MFKIIQNVSSEAARCLDGHDAEPCIILQISKSFTNGFVSVSGPIKLGRPSGWRSPQGKMIAIAVCPPRWDARQGGMPVKVGCPPRLVRYVLVVSAVYAFEQY